MVKVNILTLSQASIPTKSTKGSAGYDVKSSINTKIEYGKIEKVPLGFSLEISEGYVGLLCPRSSLGSKGITTPNSVGVIDSDYRGEVAILLQNENPDEKPFEVRVGDRVGQLLLLKTEEVEFNRVSKLSNTKRGVGGFGSTGV